MRGLNLGLGYGAGLRPVSNRIAGNNIGYAIGDSRSRATASPAGGYNQRYPLTVARQLCAGQLYVADANIHGVAG